MNALLKAFPKIAKGVVSKLSNYNISLNRTFLPVRGQRAGVVVNAKNAMSLAAFYRGVRYISDMLMSMPWNVHLQTDPMGSSYPVYGRLHWLLNEQSNDELNANIWRHLTVQQMIVHGNSYSEILRDSQGRPLALGHPIEWGRTQMYRDKDTDEIFYRVYNTPDRNKDEGFVDLPRTHVFHARGPGDSYQGVSIISYAMNSLGIALAQEMNTSTFFGNGSQASGILSFPGVLTKEKRSELSGLVKDMLSGPDSFNVMVLQKGETWQQLGLTNQDTQVLDSRSFSINEISRWLGLPPHILMDYSRMTWNNLEQASTETVRSGLMPWAIWLEREANAKLIAPRNRRRLSTSLNLDGLLRADVKTRTEAYAKGRQWGWLSGNDVRRREELPPIPGLDDYWQPVNMVVAATAPRPSAEPEQLRQIENAEDESERFALAMMQIDRRVLDSDASLSAQGAALPFGRALEEEIEQTHPDSIVKALEKIAFQCWESALSREINQLKQASGREDFQSWARSWVLDKHSPWLRAQLQERLFSVGALLLGAPQQGYQKDLDRLCDFYCDEAIAVIDQDGADLEKRRACVDEYAQRSLKLLQGLDNE